MRDAVSEIKTEAGENHLFLLEIERFSLCCFALCFESAQAQPIIFCRFFKQPLVFHDAG